MAISTIHFQELLARAKAAAATRKLAEAASRLQESLETHSPQEVSLLEVGGTNDTSREGQEQNIEVLSSLLESNSERSNHLHGTNSNNGASTSQWITDLITGLPISVDVSTRQASLLSGREGEVASKASHSDTSLSHNNYDLQTVEATAIAGPRIIGVARDDITLNTKQRAFNDIVLSGSNTVLIGAAGTGKTTSMRTVTRNLIDSGKLPTITQSTKHLIAGAPGAAILSFTRKAVNNIRHAVVAELKAHTLTLHKLLEFGPEFYEIEDPNSPGSFKKTMRFTPGRNRYNPLPSQLTFLAFEESSMISTLLYEQLQEAMPHEHQEVFLGDIQQLPPIFGQAILGFKMLELQVIELTEVYRQAAESPIIDLAWKILSGDSSIFSPETKTVKIWNKRVEKEVSRIQVPSLDKLSRCISLDEGRGETEVVFQPWQKNLDEDYANMTAIRQFCAWSDSDYYNPQEDIILCPFNKGVGTIEINKGISDFLGKQRGAEIHEVIAGFNKHYLAVGDRVLYDKEDAFIVAIRRNAEYLGKSPAPSSTQLDRWGHLAVEKLSLSEKLALENSHAGDLDLAAIERFFSQEGGGDVEDRVVLASHTVEIRYAYSEEFEEPVVLKSASEINNLLGGYCITVHKFQGSEAERVFLLFHHTHAVMIQRELLYTAVTRARRFLHIICERDTFFKGVRSQKIKGNTLEEKAEWFKGKVASLPSSLLMK